MTRLPRNAATVGLDLVPVMGVLAIAAALLLRSFSTDGVAVRPSSDLEIPVAIGSEQAPMVVNVVVSSREILVDGVPVVDLERTVDESGAGVVRIPASAKDGPVVRELLAVLSRKALAAEVVTGRVTLQADRRVPYAVLREVMYTSALARFGEFRFVAIEGG